jgi:pyruvate formate lyase activating enzyme
MAFPARYWSVSTDHDRLICEICPRFCGLKDGQRGLCFVRKRQGNQIVLDTYGRSSGFCIDPIEKKPLNHFFPGTPVLSFGTAGCNLACKFCQNHDISKSRDQDALMHHASPEKIADVARQYGCRSVAYTYNDPVIFLEYAVDIAAACSAQNIKNVAVTAGYICDAPREEFFGAMDATNIDLKGFTERFYKKVTGSEIQPVLETISYVVQETQCWVELTTLLIPGENDDPKEIEALSRWVLDTCGADTPLHFTAFHPDFRMLTKPATPPETVLRARRIALTCGLRHVYVGNIKNYHAQSSYCTGCGTRVIGRDWHIISTWLLNDFGNCSICGTQFVGYIDGMPGDWGRKRMPIEI